MNDDPVLWLMSLAIVVLMTIILLRVTFNLWEYISYIRPSSKREESEEKEMPKKEEPLFKEFRRMTWNWKASSSKPTVPEKTEAVTQILLQEIRDSHGHTLDEIKMTLDEQLYEIRKFNQLMHRLFGVPDNDKHG